MLIRESPLSKRSADDVDWGLGRPWGVSANLVARAGWPRSLDGGARSVDALRHRRGRHGVIVIVDGPILSVVAIATASARRCVTPDAFGSV